MNEKFRLNDVHRKIEKVTHVDGIEYSNDGTWSVVWSEGTTQEQQDEILAILGAIDVNQPTAPRYVTKIKLVKAMREQGRLNAFRGMLNQLGQDSDAMLDWEYNGVIDVEGELVAEMKTRLSLSDDDIEELFRGAV